MVDGHIQSDTLVSVVCFPPCCPLFTARPPGEELKLHADGLAQKTAALVPVPRVAASSRQVCCGFVWIRPYQLKPCSI